MKRKINWAGITAVIVIFLAFWDPVVASVLAVISLLAIAFSRQKIIEEENIDETKKITDKEKQDKNKV